jgi:glutathione S-transferase
MMILSTSPASPFGRKVQIAAGILGFANDLTLEIAEFGEPQAEVRNRNPLGKIPVLRIEDGTTLYDSRVILEYLDHRAGGGKIIPAEPSARFSALRMQALADGILDASILIVYESRHRPPERRHPDWVERQNGKAVRSLAELAAAPPALTATPDIGQIAVACALGYRDLRFEGSWRKDYPNLVTWLEAFAARVPAFAATKIAS